MQGQDLSSAACDDDCSIALVRRSRKAGSDSEEEYRGRGRGFSDHEEDLDEAMQVGNALLALQSQSHSFSQNNIYLQHKIAAKKKAVTRTWQLTQCDW